MASWLKVVRVTWLRESILQFRNAIFLLIVKNILRDFSEMLKIVIIFICGNKALNMAGETINIGHQGRTIKMLF